MESEANVTPAILQKRVNTTALSSGNVVFSRHAQIRLVERDITIKVAIDVLRSGFVHSDISIDMIKGEYKFNVTATIQERKITVVAVMRIKDGGNVYVVTAMHVHKQ